MSDDRLEILKMIETGQISTEEALPLLDAVNQAELANAVQVEAAQEMPPADVPQKGNWWLIPTAAGAVVMAMGAPLLALGLSGRVKAFWAICCGWLPFFIGLAILTLGAWSRGARWLHLRIQEAHTGRRTIAFSFPLPLRFSAWVMKIIRPFVPQVKDVPVEEMVLAMRDAWSDGDDQPIFIEVQDDRDDEHVMVYIG